MFDKIAEDWARKRKKEWKLFVEIVEPWIEKWARPKDELKGFPFIFIDLGCGSGRNSEFLLTKCRRLIDLDESREMLKLNTSKSIKVQAHMKFLPFRFNTFDGAFLIASLHHVKGLNARQHVIGEIYRIGKDNAIVSITVWRFYQKKFIAEFLKQLNECSKEKSDREIGDVDVSWTLSQKNGNHKINRFYHLFRVVEFKKLMSSFEKLHRSVMGKGVKKNNFIFIGEISK